MRFLRRPRPRDLGLTADPPAFLLGFAAAAFQIFLLREFSVHFHGNELVFGIVLASWLFWGGVGSLAGQHLVGARAALDRLFYAVVLLFPAGLVGLRFSRFILGTLPGELTGMAPALATAMAIGFVSSFPLGALFALIAGLPGGSVPRVYAFESLGAVIAGLTVSLGLVPLVSNWQGTALVAGAAAAGVFLTFGQRRSIYSFATVLALLVAFYLGDLPSQRIWWKPFELVGSRETPYGKLQAVRAGDQVSIYSSGLPVLSFPDPAAAETPVHFAMLQRPGARKVLLVGGGAGGGLGEILKYRDASADYVELDPGIIRVAEAVIGESGRAALRDPRARVHYGDGLKFLMGSSERYDVIILNLPEPATAQINRFYTREFFVLARSRLASGGVFSFVVPSSEDSLGADLRRFLSSLHATLRAVFPVVRVVPGNTNVFLASSAPLTLDPNTLERRIEDLGLPLISINAALLSARLNPLRTERLADGIGTGPARLNLDLAPAAYYFHSVLWSSQFGGLEAGMLRFFERVPVPWLLGVPLFAYALVLVGLALRRKRRAVRPFAPVWTMGFTTIVIELAAIVAFQSFYGYVYGKLSLLLSAFMGGLFLGAWPRRSPKPVSAPSLLPPQAGFLLIIAAFRLSLANRAPEALFYVLLLVLGALGGRLFVASARSVDPAPGSSGRVYGADLLGSFLGALAAAALLIPLAGILPLLDALFLMNAFCFIFIALPRLQLCRRRGISI
jgi:spermidine synthase